NAAQDAWSLDLSLATPKWSKLAPSGAAPKGRRNGCSMPDPTGRRLFVYGGTSDGHHGERSLCPRPRARPRDVDEARPPERAAAPLERLRLRHAARRRDVRVR